MTKSFYFPVKIDISGATNKEDAVYYELKQSISTHIEELRASSQLIGQDSEFAHDVCLESSSIPCYTHLTKSTVALNIGEKSILIPVHGIEDILTQAISVVNSDAKGGSELSELEESINTYI